MPDLDDNYKAEKSEAAEKRDYENEETTGGEGERPAGTRTMAESTGISVVESKTIDEDMPPRPPAWQTAERV